MSGIEDLRVLGELVGVGFQPSDPVLLLGMRQRDQEGCVGDAVRERVEARE